MKDPERDRFQHSSIPAETFVVSYVSSCGISLVFVQLAPCVNV